MCMKSKRLVELLAYDKILRKYSAISQIAIEQLKAAEQVAKQHCSAIQVVFTMVLFLSCMVLR